MPASTPIRNLPYPLPTDPVAHGADDIKALALALDGASAPLVTALPASPGDGQEVILVDSTTAPTWAWRLRYAAGIGDANKWIYVGGTPMFNEVTTAESTGSTAYIALATAGPTLTVPRAGDYMLALGFTMSLNTLGPANAYMSYDIGATAAVDADNIGSLGTGGVMGASVARERKKAGL